MNKNWRWLPAGIAPLVVAAVAVTGSAAAEAQPELPARTAQELLEFVASGSEDSYSGTVEQSSDLGLPDIQGLATPPGGTSPSDPTSAALELLTGSHTARVYVDGSERARIQVLDQLAQRDVVVNGQDLWFYDSSADEATHAELPDRAAAQAQLEAKLRAGAAEHPELSDLPRTPADLARTFLAQIDPVTEVTVGATSRVAGRDAYELRLTPEDPATLIGSIAVAVDAENGVPLSVTVQAKSQDAAAFTAGFSSVDFDAPDAAIFDFTPPASATVTEAPTPDEVKARGEDAGNGSEEQTHEHVQEQPTLLGSGWSSVVELPAGPAGIGGLATGTAPAGMDSIMDIKPGMDPQEVAGTQALLDQALVEVEGGRALQTSLVSVLITDDGRILAGAVGIDDLVAASQR